MDARLPASTRQAHVLRVEPAEEGLRVDRFLSRRLGLGRRAAMRLAAEVRLDGRWTDKGAVVRAGQELQIPVPAEASHTALADADLVLATQVVLVVAKPAGLPTLPSPLDRAEECLARRLALRFPELEALGKPGESGLVQRLDRWTSGLLLVARTEDATTALRRSLRAGDVVKTYLAVVQGRLSAATTVETTAGTLPCLESAPGPVSRRHASAWAPRGATSRVEPLHLGVGHTLIQVVATTGVRHQIRVHLASLGHPILGDTRYGGAALPAARPGFLLHAHRLNWPDPATGERVDVAQTVPGWWQAVVPELHQRG